MIDQGYLLGKRYRILDTLGEGGTANVYLAQDIILKRKVAVKILRLDLQKETQVKARFQREALATSELSHPNIVSVLDVGTDHGLPYMVMECVDGPTLKVYIKKHAPLPLHEVIRIMDQILSAIAMAHQHGVIHRDLKPQNILMDHRGNIKIADFGIAVALNQSSITQTNAVMGSVHYMSPEQTRGGLVTKQSDIYSIGIILYELISGRVPFNGDTPVAIALKHAQEPIPSLRKGNSKIPQALENVVLKATAKDPRDRYASAQEMKDDLDTSLDFSRRDEPVFVPDHEADDDKTIILPGFKPKKDARHEPTTKADQERIDSKAVKAGFWQNLRRHRWWFFFACLAAVVIVLIMVFALEKHSQSNDLHVPDVTNLSEGSAKVKIEKAGLTIGRVTKRHSDSINAGKVIETLPAAGDGIAKGKSVALVVSKGAGMVKVPNVVGQNYQRATDKLEKEGFDVARQRQYSLNVNEGEVISQSIAPGVEVKPKQTAITLIVSVGKPARPKQPLLRLKNLQNDSLRDAQVYAQVHHLTLQIIQQFSNKVAKGLVISMTPQAGTRVKRGSTIAVAVSKGRKAKQNTITTVTKTFTVRYVTPVQDEKESSNHSGDQNVKPSGSTQKGDHIQIYIKDDDHSLGNIYRDLYIKRDMSFSVPFSLKSGNGQLRVVRNGQTILNEKVTK